MDVSSTTLGAWHRALAGVPEAFAERVRERAAARVPLFTALVAFAKPVPVPLNALSFARDETLWFAV